LAGKGFFFSIHCDDLEELLEEKLTKLPFTLDWVPWEILILRLIHTSSSEIHVSMAQVFLP
jgi:hypothetical protein